MRGPIEGLSNSLLGLRVDGPTVTGKDIPVTALAPPQSAGPRSAATSRSAPAAAVAGTFLPPNSQRANTAEPKTSKATTTYLTNLI